MPAGMHSLRWLGLQVRTILMRPISKRSLFTIQGQAVRVRQNMNHSGVQASSGKPRPRRGNGTDFVATPTLKADESTVLRDQLLAETASLSSVEAAAIWARRVLGAKNSLAAVDAQLVEEAFRARLA